MPDYKITAPDGNAYTVTAPEGATQDQVLAYAQANYQHPAVQAGQPVQHADFSDVQGGVVEKPRSLGQDLGRAAIMTGRNVVHGVLGLPAMLNDATLVPAINAVSSAVGSDYREAPSSQQLDHYMNAAGIPNPQPENGTERVVSGIDRGVGGLLTGVGVGGLLSGTGSAAAQGVGGALTGNLGAQTAATGLGVGSSELAREGGLPVPAQVAVGMLGGLSPSAAGMTREVALNSAAKMLGKPSQEAAQLGQRAIDAGIPLKASQVSPSKVAKLVDSVTGQVPFSGAQGFQNTQQRAFNRAVGRTIGADSDAITADVFARAKNKASNGFNAMWRQNSLDLTPDVLKRVVSVVNDAAALGGQDVGGAMGSILDRLAKQGASGVLPGRAFQSIDSQLGQMAAMGGEKAHYAGQMQEALRDAMQSGLPKDAAARLAQLRETWKNIKTIEPLVAKDGVEGNISPAQLMGRVASNGSGKAAMASGRRGDLGDLANIGQRFLKSQIPDSGTAQRVFAGKALGSAGSIGGGLAAGSLLGPLGGLLTVGGAVGGSRLAQAVLKNPALVGSLIGRRSPSEINRLLMLSADPTAQGVMQSNQ